MSRETIIADIERLAGKYTAARDAFLTNLWVRRIGIGLQEVGGELVEPISYRVYIKLHDEPNRTTALATIPATVEGEPVFVVEVEDRPATDQANLENILKGHAKPYEKLLAGIKIKNPKVSEGDGGTLGCFARVKTTGSANDGKRVLVSNRHVLYDDSIKFFVKDGDELGQPTINHWVGDCECCTTGHIANLLACTSFGATHPTADAAIADLLPEVKIENRTRSMGATERIQGAASTIVTGTSICVIPGDRVWKDGMMTDKTEGTVVDVMYQSLTYDTEARGRSSHLYYDCMLIKPDDDMPYDLFGFSGDSGAAVLNSENQVVGLYFGRGDAWHGMACFIQNVTDQLGIEILSGDTTDGTAAEGGFPTRGIATPDGKAILPLRPRGRYARMRSHLLEISGHTTESIEHIEREIFWMINHDRPTKVAWHRYKGPAFLSAILACSEVWDRNFPQEIEGVTLANLLIAVSATMETNGSPALQKWIREQLATVLEAAMAIRSFRQLVEAINNGKEVAQ